jgi:hypothetical protein
MDNKIKILYNEIGQQRFNNLLSHYKIRNLEQQLEDLQEENLRYIRCDAS